MCEYLCVCVYPHKGACLCVYASVCLWVSVSLSLSSISFLGASMEAGFGNQTGRWRWTYRKAGPVVYAVGAAHREEAGYLGGFGEQDGQKSKGVQRDLGSSLSTYMHHTCLESRGFMGPGTGFCKAQAGWDNNGLHRGVATGREIWTLSPRRK